MLHSHIFTLIKQFLFSKTVNIEYVSVIIGFINSFRYFWPAFDIAFLVKNSEGCI